MRTEAFPTLDPEQINSAAIEVRSNKDKKIMDELEGFYRAQKVLRDLDKVYKPRS